MGGAGRACPGRASKPADWRAAAELIRGPAPDHDIRFSLGDDVGHCRLNLAVLYSAELAADVLAAYEAEAGRRVDPYWDIRCATAPAFEDWTQFIPIQVDGRAPFDRAGMTTRVDELLSAALRRL